MACFIFSEAECITGNCYRHRISEWCHIFYHDFLTWQTTHFHEFQKNFFRREFLDNRFLSGLEF